MCVCGGGGGGGGGGGRIAWGASLKQHCRKEFYNPWTSGLQTTEVNPYQFYIWFPPSAAVSSYRIPDIASTLVQKMFGIKFVIVLYSGMIFCDEAVAQQGKYLSVCTV